MEKLDTLKVLTGKEGGIRKSCSEFNTCLGNSGLGSVRLGRGQPGSGPNPR